MGRYNPRTEDNKCVFCDIIANNDQDAIFWQDEQHVAFLSREYKIRNSTRLECTIRARGK